MNFSDGAFKLRWRRTCLKHRILGERESRLGNLLDGVLVTVGQSGQAADAHHDDGVARTEHDARRSRRNRHLDPEPRPHGLDGGHVRRVAAGLDALLDRAPNLLDGDLGTEDLAIALEHRVRQGEPKKDLGHCNSPSIISMP